MKNTILSILSLIVFSLILSCSSKSVDPVNQPPTAPVINAVAGVPSSNSVDQPISINLSWLCTDPEGDTITFDIYFDTSAVPRMIVQGDRKTSYRPIDLAYSTSYYWKIVAKDNLGNESTSPIWHFQTMLQPPFPPEFTSFIPNDNAVDVAVDVLLTWNVTDPNGDSLSFSVFLDTASEPTLVQEDLSGAAYQSEGLEYSTDYYWKLIANDGNGGITISPILKFTTEVPPNESPEVHTPTPDTGSIDIGATLTLGWTMEDAEGDPLTCDIYFGNNSSPPLVAQSLSESAYLPGVLMPLTTYYWKVAVTDDHGNTTISSIWSFSTGEFFVSPLSIGSYWVWKYIYRYEDPPQTVVDYSKLAITGKTPFVWEGQNYLGYHWNWHSWPGDQPEEYYHLMSNEPAGLTVVGVGSNLHDTVYVFNSMMIKYPVGQGDTWLYEQPGGYSERWVCISTNYILETSIGSLQCIRYSVTPKSGSSPGSSPIPEGPFGAMVLKNRLAHGLGASLDIYSQAFYIYYTPDIGFVGIKDPIVDGQVIEVHIAE